MESCSRGVDPGDNVGEEEDDGASPTDTLEPDFFGSPNSGEFSVAKVSYPAPPGGSTKELGELSLGKGIVDYFGMSILRRIPKFGKFGCGNG